MTKSKLLQFRVIGVLARALLTFLCLGWLSGNAGAMPESGIDFFEKHVRPVFVDQCYSCHSAQAEKVKGGLLLDSREALLKGGSSGPVLVAGDPDKSLLIQAVRYTDENLQMPPKGKKLSSSQIAALEEWVKMGAPDPRTGPGSKGASKKDHWAFRPVRLPPVPPVRNESWVQEPLDAFILAKLEANRLVPAPPADKRTLLRRVTFDLTGLPPTPEELSDFLADQAPDAWSRVIDRLLSSPRYGERWARHWLDVARYADTKGYVFEEERRYPYAYTYRDYVIRALNDDLPFDQFIVQQIAADQLPLGDDQRPLAALGYLTLGRRFLNNPHDIIDDRIDVVARGMMGLTVACARCHDHKFDPISTQDYYSLYGVFASCSEPEEKPLLGARALPQKHAEYLEAHQRRQDELDQFRRTKEAQIRAHVRQITGEYLLAARDVQVLGDASKGEALARERQLDPPTVQRWVKRLEELKAQPADSIFAPWFLLADCADDQVAERAGELLQPLLRSSMVPINPLVAAAFSGPAPTSMSEVAARYGILFAEAANLDPGTNTVSVGATNRAEAATGVEPAFAALQQVLDAPNSPAVIPDAEITRLFDVPSIQKLRALKRKVEELAATHPGAPPRAMALQDNPTPQAPHVLVRGNPGNVGGEVPRQFLAVLSGEKRRPFTHGSGRLELAQAIASADNPLTARVLVNRIWMHYFSNGLVRTPSDFGMRSEPPSHPELLDYLAARFMAEGWSLKKLHRWILLSSTYQQASDNPAVSPEADPSNQLLWKMNRRRLDFEAMRDALLAVAGRLDLTEGGHAVDLVTEPFTARRTVYGFVERQNLPSLFRTFDFASPDSTSPGRFTTTVPQQALFMLNSPFVVEQSRALAHRSEPADSSEGGARVAALVHTVYQREPSARETELALQFIEAQTAASSCPAPASNQPGSPTSKPESSKSLTPWERYAQVLLMSNEFLFLD